MEIVDFFRNFTVDVVGVGDVCSFAQLDVRKRDKKMDDGGKYMCNNRKCWFFSPECYSFSNPQQKQECHEVQNLFNF